MNTTARRIALVAPIATALLGFGITGANAQPYHPGINDAQIQNLPPVVVVDPPFGGNDPVDPPTADPTTPAPPADSDDDHHDGHHGDHHSDHSNDSSNTRTVVKVVKVADNSDDSSNDSNDTSDEQATDTIAPVDTTTAQPGNVQVPIAVVGAGALGLAGLAGWAAYRRYKMFN